MDRFMKFGPFFVVLGLCLVFAVLFPLFLTRYLIEPIALVLWLIWRTLLSVDQSLYWGLLVLLCAMGMLALIPRSDSDTSASPGQEPQAPGARLERWQALFHEAARGGGEEESLRLRLRSVLAAVIGADGQPDPAELERELASRKLRLPPRAQQYLFPSAPERNGPTLHGRQHFLSQARASLRRLTGKSTVADDAAIQELLGWMESMMEISHDE